MTTIVPFIIQRRADRRISRPDCPATIIIFPGVRYERMPDCDVKTLPRMTVKGSRVRKHDGLPGQ